MGMYTELIFGAGLKEDTPTEVIETLQYMMGDKEDMPKGYPFEDGSRHEILFRCGSFYFGVNNPVRKMWYDDISKNWRISTRANIKNYGGEIESFLEWVLPYIDQGSGSKSMYAIVIYEEDETPTIYYKGDRE